MALHSDAMKKRKQNEVGFGRNAKTEKTRKYPIFLPPSFDDAGFDTYIENGNANDSNNLIKLTALNA